MSGFETRIKLWDKEKKIMLPSAPLYKCDFFNPDISKYILLFSTGLKDKNGKEIYEGDILSCDQWKPNLHSIVEWDKEDAGFIMCSNDTDYFIEDTFNSWVFDGALGNFTIIGNIHVNPELIA